MQARNDAASQRRRTPDARAKQDATRQIVAARNALRSGIAANRSRRRAAESRARHRCRVRRLSQRRGLADRRHAGAEPDAGRAERLRRQHRQCASAAAVLAVATGRVSLLDERQDGGRWSAPLARRQPAAPRIGSFRPRRATRHARPRHLRSQSVRTPRLPAFLFARVSASLAFQIVSVAVGWQIYELSGSALDLGLIGWRSSCRWRR